MVLVVIVLIEAVMSQQAPVVDIRMNTMLCRAARIATLDTKPTRTQTRVIIIQVANIPLAVIRSILKKKKKKTLNFFFQFLIVYDNYPSYTTRYCCIKSTIFNFLSTTIDYFDQFFISY